jgi:hypothetical protein
VGKIPKKEHETLSSRGRAEARKCTRAAVRLRTGTTTLLRRRRNDGKTAAHRAALKTFVRLPRGQSLQVRPTEHKRAESLTSSPARNPALFRGRAYRQPDKPVQRLGTLSCLWARSPRVARCQLPILKLSVCLRASTPLQDVSILPDHSALPVFSRRNLP